MNARSLEATHRGSASWLLYASSINGAVQLNVLIFMIKNRTRIRQYNYKNDDNKHTSIYIYRTVSETGGINNQLYLNG